MPVSACPIPQATLLEPGRIAAASFWDSYRAPLIQTGLSMPELFAAIFAHHPAWVKVLLIARNRAMARLGAEVATDSQIWTLDLKPAYAVGDTIGPWPIFTLTGTELIAGRDNSHLDFRVSLLKTLAPTPNVTVTTVCNVHTTFGHTYLAAIKPFHRWGVRTLLQRAQAAGRI
jgi:hypothetical protein